jgi:hypothetical protein
MIPFHNTVTEAMVKGLSVAEIFSRGRVTSEIKALWWYIEQKLRITTAIALNKLDSLYISPAYNPGD